MLAGFAGPDERARADSPDAGSPDAATVPSMFDPIGSGGLEDVEAQSRVIAHEREAAAARPPDPEVGRFLTARPGAREVGHRVDVRFEAGHAEIWVTVDLANRGRYPTPITYTLPLPEGARGLDARWAPLEASGAPVRPFALPDHARALALVRADDGGGLTVVLPELAAGRSLRLLFRYGAPAPRHGGIRRVVLPARRGDVRVAPALVHVIAPAGHTVTVLGRTVADALEVDPFSAVPVVVSAPAGDAASEATTMRCGDAHCSSLRVAAGPSAARPRRLVLLLDASPSTHARLRGRIAESARAVLAELPGDTPVQLATFGGRVVPAFEGARPASSIDASAIGAALDADAGHATLLDGAVAFAEDALELGHGPAAVVLVGDGRSTQGSGSHALGARLARLRATTSYVQVGDAPIETSLEGVLRAGRVRLVYAGEAAEQAARSGELALVREIVRACLVDTVARSVRVREVGTERELGPLVAGEEIRWVGRTRRAPVFIVDGRSLRARRVEPGSVESALLDLPATAVVASAPPTESRAGGVVPATIVRGMLRERVIPVARGCLRDDRRGRLRYSVHAEFVFRMEHAEIAEAEVRGAMAEPLRACLLDALFHLEVPAFEGAIRVRYPIRTLEADEPPIVELDPETAARLRAIFGEPTGEVPTLPSP